MASVASPVEAKPESRERRFRPLGVHSPYSGREMMAFILDPAFLSKHLFWYDDFISENMRIKEMYRQSGNTGKFESNTAGFNQSRTMKHLCRIPESIVGMMIAFDEDLADPKSNKIYAFLKDHPEYDVRTLQGA